MGAFAILYGAWQVVTLLAVVGLLDMGVQGLLVGPVVKRLGDRSTMVIGLAFGAVGIMTMGLAPTGLLFLLAMLPNALWGLAMPTIQSLMTRRVSESEQGQLQGANSSVGSIAGIASPLFFGWIYSLSAGPAPTIPFIGTAFVIAALVLASAAALGWAAGRGLEPAVDGGG